MIDSFKNTFCHFFHSSLLSSIGNISLASGCTAIGTSFFSLFQVVTISPFVASGYIATCLVIYSVSTPLFLKGFKSVEHSSLGSKAYLTSKWVFALWSSKALFFILGSALSVTQISWIIIAFLITSLILQRVFQQYKSLSLPTAISKIPLKIR